MSKRLPGRADNLRRALAQEAARIMAEHGIHDFLLAKRKAAERFAVEDAGALPKNVEVEAALVEYQRLFGGDAHAETIQSQRRTALDAMRRLTEFEPRLVGPVLNGTATAHSEIQLHLFTDFAESVAIKLIDAGIPHEITEKRMRMDPSRVLNIPGVRFELNEHGIEATVFPTDGIRQAPVSPVDGKPMRRVDADELEALIEYDA